MRTTKIVFYTNLAKDVRGFTAAEIVAESPAYFTGLARRLGVYLKKIEERGELVAMGMCVLLPVIFATLYATDVSFDVWLTNLEKYTLTNHLSVFK